MKRTVVAGMAFSVVAGGAWAQEIVSLPTAFTPTCISGDGRVVAGSFADAAGGHPALWTREGGVELLSITGDPNTTGRVWAINVDGTAAAGLATGHPWQNPMRWTRTEGVRLFPNVTDGSTSAYGISDDGSVIVGMGMLGGRAGFTWTAAQGLRNLPQNGDGQATCVSGDGRFFGGGLGSIGRAGIWLWSMDSYTGRAVSVDAPLTGWARSLSRAGDVMVGSYTTNTTRGFVWTTQGFEVFDEVFSFEDVTDDGRVAVGRLQTGRAAYYTSGLGAVDLASFLQDSFGMDVSGRSLSSAVGISYDGRTITGRGSPNNWVVYLPASRPADFNGDESVTVDDLIDYMDCFVGANILPPTSADLTRDDFTDWIDFDEFLADF